MRMRLKDITADAHERMHGHAGFGAAASGAISDSDYRDLLARLYGFHAAFDLAMSRAPAALSREIEIPERNRAELIVQDLAGLGCGVAGLPLCEDMPEMRSEGDYLGALYVVEGSTLGGVIIARALEPSVGDNRRFFQGHGGEHGRLWRNFVARLDRLDDEPTEAADAERTAVSAFAAFERWMADWRGAYAASLATA